MADPRVLQRLPFLDACFQEAIRLHIAGFFLREVCPMVCDGVVAALMTASDDG